MYPTKKGCMVKLMCYHPHTAGTFSTSLVCSQIYTDQRILVRLMLSSLPFRLTRPRTTNRGRSSIWAGFVHIRDKFRFAAHFATISLGCHCGFLGDC